MDKNDFLDFDPMPDFELQAMTSIIQENPVLRDLIDNGDINIAYDYIYNRMYRESQTMKPLIQHDSNPKPSQENPLIINPNDNNDHQTWMHYAQILDPQLQSMSPMGNNIDLSQQNPNISDTRNHQQTPLPIPPVQNNWVQREGKRPLISEIPEVHPDSSVSNTKKKMKSINSLIVHGQDLEDHVHASWAFVSKLGNDVESSSPREESSVLEVSNRRKPNIWKPYMELVINGIEIDTPKIPLPVCSCTGIPRKCFRWGGSGWQSTCCTATMSTYPLPMGNIRRGTRIAGRKMSKGTFKLVLEHVISRGHNFLYPIDLKTYWGKHGINQFRAIRIHETPSTS